MSDVEVVHVEHLPVIQGRAYRYLLQENGFKILQENGFALLIEGEGPLTITSVKQVEQIVHVPSISSVVSA